MKNIAVEIVQADTRHIKHLAENMRAIDKKEVWAMSQKSPAEALFDSLGKASAGLCHTALINDRPALMWGVGPAEEGAGIPWMLATDDLELVSRRFVRQSREYVEKMQAPFNMLFNYVHAENEISQRWLKWCGFYVETDKQHFFNDEPFYLFWRLKNV